MTIGTATVASTNVRATGDSVPSHSPRSRLRTVRVGKTASQIMTASWCLDGGPRGRAVGGAGFDIRCSCWLGNGSEGSVGAGLDAVASLRSRDRVSDVLVDEVGV